MERFLKIPFLGLMVARPVLPTTFFMEVGGGRGLLRHFGKDAEIQAMEGNRLRTVGLSIVLACLSACATVEQPHRSDLGSALEEVRDCAKLFDHYDSAVDEAGVRDSAYYRIPGFPYLRVDRFLASFRNEVVGEGRAFEAWLARLKELATQARRYELANTPPISGIKVLGETSQVADRLDYCADRLASADLASPDRRELLRQRTQAPDEYSESARIFGLYPLASLPFSLGVHRWQQDTLELFRHERPEAPGLIRYGPAADRAGSAAIRALFAQTPLDALGIPRFKPDALDSLFQAFAPVYEVETSGDFDRIGSLVWQGQPSPTVQGSNPTVYRRLAFTRFQGHVLAQLVYTVWFSQRPSSGAFDLLSGKLDGLVFRVTLDGTGRPLVYDSIHPCGCYHLFFPTDRVEALPTSGWNEEGAFVPKKAPELLDSERLALRVASRSHYLVGLRPHSGQAVAAYAFAWEDDLRSLPYLRSGGSRSGFDAGGFMSGTERAERFLFWPMGIANPGAMRQWGRHATAFVGRRHFDDADLLEKRFEIKP